MEVDLSYGQLANFIFESNLPATSTSITQKLLQDVCNLMGLNAADIHDSCLNLLKQSLSAFCYTFRKKYKNAAYNKTRLRLLSWCSLRFKHTITQPEFSGECSKSLKTQPEFSGECSESLETQPEFSGETATTNDQSFTISRLELFQQMKESKIPIANIGSQTDMLCKHIVCKLQLVLKEDDLLLLERRLRFFVLDINKRFRENGIRQNPEHFVKKYTKPLSSFLSKDFYMKIKRQLDMSDCPFEMFHETDLQPTARDKRMRLGNGRLYPTNFKSSSVKNNTGKVTTRRVGLSRLEKNIPKLHNFRV
jgi:hypothetical protein